VTIEVKIPHYELVLLACFALVLVPTLMLPNAYAATTTISTDSFFESLVVNEGDTLVIDPEVEVAASSITNNGTITNRGSIVSGGEIINGGIIENYGFLSSDSTSNDGGTIENYGTLRFMGVHEHFYNMNGGTINVKENARFEFLREGSYQPHNLYNDASSLVDNYGTVAEIGYPGMTIQNQGSLYKQCSGTYTIPVIGNPIIDKCTPAEQHTLTISSSDLDENPISGMWTTIRTLDGTLLKSGFTPITFKGDADIEYKVSVANYDGREFSRWEDGSTSRTRTIDLTSDTTITAHYDPGDSLRGFTSLVYTGTEEQPDLTVDAVNFGSSQELHMWAIIDPQSTDDSGTTYKVIVHNYKDRVFDHWEDGSTNPVRVLAIQENKAITAFYNVG